MTTLIHNKRFHGFAKHALTVLATVLLGAVLVLWSWNTIVADLFTGPAMHYKHALAMVAVAAFANFILRGPGRQRHKKAA